jgi:hypothetical protein
VKISWDEENPVGGTETPVLVEMISPNNSKIPRRNQGIANGGLGDALTVVLEREREVRKMVKGREKWEKWWRGERSAKNGEWVSFGQGV